MSEDYRMEPMTIGQYLERVENEDIKDDQAVQREFCWASEMIDALIYSALSNKIYIPNVILAEENKGNGTTQTYIVDGGQRTEALRIFMYDKYRIKNNLRSYMVSYQRKMFDKDGQVLRDEYGNIQFESLEYDIRKKRYEDLPIELKKKIESCPLMSVIYQNCTPEKTSELVLIYNNHVGMNTSQRSLTYVGKYAEEIKRIRNTNRFLMDGTVLSEKEKKNGIWERVIAESVMIVNHFEHWNKNPKKICDYLNNNSSKEEIRLIETYFNRLNRLSDKIENPKVASLFTAKNLFIWIKVYSEFEKLNIDDSEFGNYLNAFVDGLYLKPIDEETWNIIDSNRNTKDKSTIIKKENYLKKLMFEFLHISTEDEDASIIESEFTEDETDSVEEFIKQNIKSDVTETDIDDYYSMLETYKRKNLLKKQSPLLDWKNEFSVISLIAYSFEHDIDLDDWLRDLECKTIKIDFLQDQKENYIHMKNSLEEFVNKNNTDYENKNSKGCVA